MSSFREIVHHESGQTLVSQAKWCDSFASKLRGFTFNKAIGEPEGLVLVYKKDSKLDTSIHMLFVPFALGVIWVNDAGIIVDTVCAQPWKLSYSPKMPARYVIETHPEILDKVKLGDAIEFRTI